MRTRLPISVKTGVNTCVMAALLPLLLSLANCQESQLNGAKGNSPFLAMRELVVRGQYKEAIPRLKTFLESSPNHQHASRAGLFLGKAHMAMGELDKAESAFQMTLKKYAGTLEAHKAKYKLGVVAMLSGQYPLALSRFKALSFKPDGPLAAEATAMVKYLESKLK